MYTLHFIHTLGSKSHFGPSSSFDMYAILAARSHGQHKGSAPPNAKRGHPPKARGAAKCRPQLAMATHAQKHSHHVTQKRSHHVTKPCSKFSLAMALCAENVKRLKHASEPKPKLQKRKMGTACDPGSVFENDLEHVKPHKAEGWAHECLRCSYILDKGSLGKYASLPLPSGRLATWVEPTPSHMGGTWALGCRICAWHCNFTAAGGARRTHRKQLPEELRGMTAARHSKFAGFNSGLRNVKLSEVRLALLAHTTSQGHEKACKAMLEKDRDCNLSTQSQAPPAINPLVQAAFKGRVPKPKDWFDCFVDCRNLISWRKQANVHLQKSGANSEVSFGRKPLAPPGASESDSLTTEPKDPGNGQPYVRGKIATPLGLDGLRKRRRKQTKMMAECLRERHRNVLRKAQFCSLALDEAQGRRLVHFRCDYHKPPWYYQGSLGIFDVGAKTMEESGEDHALKALTRLDEFITKFCTPLRKASLGMQCDQELKDHLLKIVSTVSADGGPSERRAVILACEPGSTFPNPTDIAFCHPNQEISNGVHFACVCFIQQGGVHIPAHMDCPLNPYIVTISPKLNKWFAENNVLDI